MAKGLTIRELREEDLTEALSLLNAHFAGSYEFVPYSVDYLRDLMRKVGSLLLVAHVDASLIGLLAYLPGPWGHRIEFLALDLVRAPEKTMELLIQRIESITGIDRVYVIIEAGSPEIDLWKRLGYCEEQVWCQMVAPLKEPEPIPPVRCGAVLRSLRKDEDPQLVKMVNQAFGFQRISKGCIARWAEEHCGFDEQWVHVAEVNGELVSALVSSTDDEYNKDFGGKRGYLGPAATLPKFEGLGLVTALTRRAMNFLLEKGMDSVSLYTAESNAPSQKLVSKLGFRVCSRWVQLGKRLSAAPGQTGKFSSS